MILVTGGAGYIGSHTNKLLAKNGYETLVYDNFICGHPEFVQWGQLVQADLADEAALEKVFTEYSIDAVIHFAAFAYVGESVENPSKYYQGNVANTLRLLDAMRRHGCRRIVFSSSCTTYGIPASNPIVESMPQAPISPYGWSKLMIEKIFADYARAYGLQYVVLRYFNAAGADPECEIGEWHVPETHLIPLVLEACAGDRESIKIFGDDYDTPDGTCIRDYIHVSDLAKAHLLALRHLEQGGQNECLNLGNQQGTSVLEIVNTAKAVTGRDCRVEMVGRRPGDPAELVGGNAKVRRVLGWEPDYPDIHTIMSHAWEWYVRSKEMRDAAR